MQPQQNVEIVQRYGNTDVRIRVLSCHRANSNNNDVNNNENDNDNDNDNYNNK